MANLKAADEEGLCMEMFKYGSSRLKKELLKCFNSIFRTGEIDDSWTVAIFQMLPKTGNLNDVANWRPIAILPILYKIFAKLVYQRISPRLFLNQSADQHAFTPSIRIEDALLCAEVTIEYSLEFQQPLWLMSMDMRKAFDTISHAALFDALERHGVESGYISLLKLIYRKQIGQANGSRTFPIRRGVRQGDVLSAILFNCVLDIAFESWKSKLDTHGLYWGYGLERLTNTRYADDILLYAKSLSELQTMAELLIEELQLVGLQLNASKTKILRSDMIHEKDTNVNVVDISSEMRHILKKGEFH